ncbi:MAG: sigma-54-dependent Fis family transcriptional regulator [Victivallales bacterium]|nr:sigma-54-dependent Fis family transcriptional regulator [Victivallales bacterium]
MIKRKSKGNALVLHIGDRNSGMIDREMGVYPKLECVHLSTPSGLSAFLENGSPDIVIIEHSDKFDDFISYVSYIQRSTEAPIIVTSTSEHCNVMVGALRNGADNFLCEPFAADVLVEAVFEALRLRVLWREVHDLHNEKRTSMGKIIGAAPSMQELYRTIQNVCKTDATVFIVGQSGTGKELVARAIHENGSRSQKHFVAINCGAIPPNLLESELFGHVRGAFTGAVKSRKGKFEQANDATLFLDEICEIPVDLQVKLLRVLQERRVTRVGGEEEIPVNARIICATNKNPFEEVKKGNFREDLYYRLNVVPIGIPPLSERRQDIPLLCAHFLHVFTEKYSKYFYEFSPGALRRLCSYDWPGNVRELENILERIVVLREGAVVEESFLPEEIMAAPVVHETLPQHFGGGDGDSSLPYRVKPLWKVEVEMIKAALQETRGNVVKASKILEIGQASLYRKLKTFGIKKSEFLPRN